jgi:hypothetical protein
MVVLHGVDQAIEVGHAAAGKVAQDTAVERADALVSEEVIPQEIGQVQQDVLQDRLPGRALALLASLIVQPGSGDAHRPQQAEDDEQTEGPGAMLAADAGDQVLHQHIAGSPAGRSWRHTGGASDRERAECSARTARAAV